jgi:hypothetical protein
VTLFFSGDDEILVDWFDGTRVKELYLVSSMVAVLIDKLVTVVASTGCRIVGVVIVIISIMITTVPMLTMQQRPVLHNCNNILDIIVLTPTRVFPAMMDREDSLLKRSCFILRGQHRVVEPALFFAR